MFVNNIKSFVRKSGSLAHRASISSSNMMPSRAFSVELAGFGAHNFMGDVADEFLKPQGLSWADLENGEWTKDVATSDKVTSYFFNKSL